MLWKCFWAKYTCTSAGLLQWNQSVSVHCWNLLHFCSMYPTAIVIMCAYVMCSVFSLTDNFRCCYLLWGNYDEWKVWYFWRIGNTERCVLEGVCIYHSDDNFSVTPMVGLGIVVIVFGYLLSIFRLKYQGYPYRYVNSHIVCLLSCSICTLTYSPPQLPIQVIAEQFKLTSLCCNSYFAVAYYYTMLCALSIYCTCI